MSRPTNRLTLDQLLATAQRSLAMGRADRVEALLRPLLAIHPDEPRARILMAQATMARSPETGLAHLLKADARAWSSSTYWLLRARAERRLGRLATNSARRAVATAPDRIDALFQDLQQVAGQHGPGLDPWLARLLVTRPYDAESWLCLAQSETDSRRGRAAFLAARRALLLDPADGLNLLWLARTATPASAAQAVCFTRRCLPVATTLDYRTLQVVAHAVTLTDGLPAAVELIESEVAGHADRSDLHAALALYRLRLGQQDRAFLDLQRARRTHRLAATALLGERRGAYHILDVTPGWNHATVVDHRHSYKSEADADYCRVLWGLVETAVRPGPGRRIVDIGPADGLITVRSAAAGASVTAIEPTCLFAERVELFSRLYGVADRVSVIRGTLGIEPLEYLAAADTIVCLGVLYHLADITSSLELLARSRRRLVLETSVSGEDWLDDSRGRLHTNRLRISWPWLLRTLRGLGYAPTEVDGWAEFQTRKTGFLNRRMLVAEPVAGYGAGRTG